MKIIEATGGKSNKQISITEEIALRRQITEKERENEELKQLLENYKTQVKQLTGERDDLIRQLKNTQNQLNSFLKEREKFLEEKERLIQTRNSLQNQLRELQTELHNYADKVKKLQKENEELRQFKEQIEKHNGEILGDIDNLQSMDEDLIVSLLTPAEYKIYQHRKQKYLDEFEINSSSDLILLQDTLFHEIMHVRLLQQKYQDPKADVLKQIEECVGRIQKNLEALGMLRKQRLTQKEQVEASIADLIMQFDKEKLLHKTELYTEEEQREALLKQERDKELVDYESAVKKFHEVFLQAPVVDNTDGVEIDGDTEEVVE
jgi:uncharacterized phage infection (PIP) family protein YhgE